MNPHLDYVALLPQIFLAATFVVVLIVDLFISDRRRGWLAVISFFGTIAALESVIWLALGSHYVSTSAGSFVVDEFSLLASGIVLSAAAVVFLFGLPSSWRGEYCLLLLTSVLGMTLIASARELLTFFVAFELLAVPGYILVGWYKKTSQGTEAAMKYYLLGVLASAVMLYGISFVFGITGSTDFKTIALVTQQGGNDISLLRLAIFFMIVGIGFKISAVPFHFWTPDAYQGAPLPVAAFLSVASKIAGFVALIVLVALVFPASASIWSPLIYVIAIATMTVGNLLALRQTDAVRLLAYSGIAQAGYALIPLATSIHGANAEAIQATFEFLVIYAATNLGAFAVVIVVARARRSTSLDAFSGMFRSFPLLATVMTVFLLSLAGIPPLGGWFAKFAVISQAISTGTTAGTIIAVVAALNTAVGLVYYLGFVRKLWLDPAPETADENSEQHPGLDVPLTIVLGLTTLAVVVMGVLPQVVTQVGGWSSLIN